ncbi:MAG: glucokinase [Thalassotalea sp.]
MTDSINLVADIGGTNIRLGLADATGDISALTVFQCREYDGLADVLTKYIADNGIEDKTINACLAIACPVDNDLISMTNLPWTFSKSAIKAALKLNKLILINDYTAIAHSVPYLTDDQKVQIGAGEVVNGRPISICGPGTGLGVANIVPNGDAWISLGGEGGHVDFAPIDKVEQHILNFLLKKYSHVSYEQLLSGLGIEQIYQALCDFHGESAKNYSAKDISSNAVANSCARCVETLAQFCKTLGSFAGNLSLNLGSFAGVYIAGGIAPRFIDFIKNSDFRTRFEEKGRLSGFNKNIPTYIITETQPGILGALAYLRQHNKEEF